MKKLLFALVLLTAFAPAVLAEEAPVVETLDFEQVEAQAEVVEPANVEPETATLQLADLPVTALELAIQEVSANYECPPYTTYCRRDRNCDAYCGATGAGACVNGCCACYF